VQSEQAQSNPDLPDDERAYIYKVWDCNVEETSETNSEVQDLTFDADLAADALTAFMSSPTNLSAWTGPQNPLLQARLLPGPPKPAGAMPPAGPAEHPPAPAGVPPPQPPPPDVPKPRPKPKPKQVTPEEAARKRGLVVARRLGDACMEAGHKLWQVCFVFC